MKHRTAALTGALATSFILLTACSTSAPSGGDGGDSDGAPTVTLVTGGQQLDFYITMSCGAQKAADEFDVDLTVQGPPLYSLPDSLQVLNGVIQTHPNGVVLVPVDPTGLNAAVTQLIDDGTQVVTVDGQLSEPLDTSNYRSDNIEGGRQAATALGEALGGTGKVAIEALAPTAVYNAERVKGFQDEMAASFPDIELLEVTYDSGDKNKAAQNIAATLQAHPDLAGIFGAQQTAGEGAVSAVAAAGLTDQVKVAAYDADPAQVQSLRDGAYVALIAQAPYYQGYESVKLLSQILSGETDPATVEYQQFTDTVAVTVDNVDDADVKPYLYVNSCS